MSDGRNRKIARGGISDLANVRSPAGGNQKATKPRKGKGKGTSIIPGDSLADRILSEPSNNLQYRKKTPPNSKRAGFMTGRKRGYSSGDYLDKAEYSQSRRQSESGHHDRIASTQTSRNKKQRNSSSIFDPLEILGQERIPKKQHLRNYGTPKETPPKTPKQVCDSDSDEYQKEPDSQEEWSHVISNKTSSKTSNKAIELGGDSEEDNSNEKDNANDGSGEYFANGIISNLDIKKDMKRQKKYSSPGMMFPKVNNHNDKNARNKRNVTRETNDKISEDKMNTSLSPGRTVSIQPKNRSAKKPKSRRKVHLDDFDNDSEEEYDGGRGFGTKFVSEGKRIVKKTINKVRRAFSPGTKTRSSRSSLRQKNRAKKSTENDVIELSSDEESIGFGQELVDDGSVDEDLNGRQNESTGSSTRRGKVKTNFSPTGNDTMRQTRKFGARRFCPATRIAIGKQIFHDSCFLNYQPGSQHPFLRLEYTDGSIARRHDSFIKEEEIVELHYYIPEDEVASCSSQNDDEKAAINIVNNYSDHVASCPDNKCAEDNALEGSDTDPGVKPVGKSSESDNTSIVSGNGTGDDEVIVGDKESDTGTGVDEAIEIGKVSDEDIAAIDSDNCRTDEAITDKKEINTPPTTSLSNETIPCCYLIMRIKPSDKNGLSAYPNKYLPDEQYPLNEGASTDKKKKRFVVIETKDKESLQAILDEMRKDDHLAAFLVTGCGLNKEEKDSYITSFQAKKRKKAITPSKYKEHDTVLVFPFQAHEAELNSAAKDLIEGSGKLLADGDSMFARNPTSESKPAENPMAKVHTVTIHGEDYDRLVPCEFLNDTLIDFWISW